MADTVAAIRSEVDSDPCWMTDALSDVVAALQVLGIFGENDVALAPGYAANIEVRDRWAIVAYVRALQLARLGSVADLPPDLQTKFK